jgi:hypothetical protein
MPGDDPGEREERWLEAALRTLLSFSIAFFTIIPIDTIEGCIDASERKGPKKKKGRMSELQFKRRCCICMNFRSNVFIKQGHSIE